MQNEITRLVRNFSTKKVLVVGDIMLDKYIQGETSRISPEAPVPVVVVKNQKNYLGGAANVAQNIVSMGGMATIIGLIGDDAAGKEVQDELEKKGIQAETLVDNNNSTIQKVRLVSNQHHIARMDYETKIRIGKDVRKSIIDSIRKHSKECDAIIISDYAKGVVCKEVMDTVRETGKPVVVDPKPDHAKLYKGVSLITPNTKEAIEMIDRSESDISYIGMQLVKELNSAVMITRGSKGVSMFSNRKRQIDIPTQAQEVYDVSGAGDAVVAASALALATEAQLKQVAIIANYAGGIKVAKFGTAPVLQSELINSVEQEISKVKTKQEIMDIVQQLKANEKSIVATNGCFDVINAKHVKFLKKAREFGNKLILCLNTDESIKQIKGYDRPIMNQEERAEVLSGLKSVDYIVFYSEPDAKNVLELIKPDVYVKGGNLRQENIVESETVIQNGGKIQLLGQDDEEPTEEIITRVKNSDLHKR